MQGSRSKRMLAMLWIFNLGICLVAAGFLWFNGMAGGQTLLFEGSGQTDPSHPPNSPGRLVTAKPSITPVPGPTQRPTITPWPTPSPAPSVTPIALPPANLFVIGYSVEHRPLEVFKFGYGPTHKLIVAGIHGGSEWNTIALADQLIAYLNDHPERVPANLTLYILHDLNPDGYARSHGVDGRVNANGVDLNRNWPYRWVANWPRDGCWIWTSVTGGASGGSEPEVQVLTKFIDEIRPVALISYHSAALGIFPGGRPDFPPSDKLAKAVSKVSDYPYPPINTGCDYTGDLTDWASNTHQIPSIDIELSDHVNTDFDQNLKILQVFLDWKP